MRLSRFVRGLIALAVVIAIGAALVAGRYDLMVVVVVFVLAAALVGYWARRRG
ncbi:MAG TPA: hypothetical protein VMD31_16120 [Opitutaceae bacterium]|nr:hypothetical protein [Opitutaceae bacterium]